MNLTAKKVFSISLILSLGFMLLCTGFRAFAFLDFYTPSLGLFDTGFFADIFLPLLYILSAVAFLVFGFIFRGSLTGREYKLTLPTLFASGFAAITTAVWLITFAINLLDRTMPFVQGLFGILMIITGILTVGYFILNTLPRLKHTLSVLFGLGAVLFCLFYAFFAYFDNAFPLNSSVKIFDQITFLVLLLFFLAEGRFRLGNMHEAIFFPVCMAAVVFAGANAIPALIYTAKEGYPLVESVMHDFLLFGMFIYALTRQISFLLPALSVDAQASVQSEAPTKFEAETAAPATAEESSAFAQEAFDFEEDEGAALAEQPTDGDVNTTQAEIDMNGQ